MYSGQKTHAPQTGAWGTPRGGVVGLGSLGELELAIGPFAKKKFKNESLAHPATSVVFEGSISRDAQGIIEIKVGGAGHIYPDSHGIQILDLTEIVGTNRLGSSEIRVAVCRESTPNHQCQAAATQNGLA